MSEKTPSYSTTPGTTAIQDGSANLPYCISYISEKQPTIKELAERLREMYPDEYCSVEISYDIHVFGKPEYVFKLYVNNHIRVQFEAKTEAEALAKADAFIRNIEIIKK